MNNCDSVYNIMNDPPHASFNGSCNLSTDKLIEEYIEYYNKQSNSIYHTKQIEQIIKLYFDTKFNNSKIILLSMAGLHIAKSNYHYELQKILNKSNNLLDLFINDYVNELITLTNKPKELIKKYIIKDKNTIDIINQLIVDFMNNISEVDIHTKLLLVLDDVKNHHIQLINSL